ncbi:MAG: chorismate-binding protein, partial [Kiritimatiellales bacterium]
MYIIVQHGSDWLAFRNPVEVLTARTPTEVFQCLEKIEESGLWAAGFVTYEAAPTFDPAHKTKDAGKLPLLQFGLFQTLEKIEPESSGTYQLGNWAPSVSRNDYVQAIAKIKEHIAAGDTYQVNYTFRLNAEFSGDPFAFFCDLAAAQQGRFGAFIETDDLVICSASPELFFEHHLGTLVSRPMKGTRSRGLTVEQDRAAAHELQNAVKDRAENIMIVDMIRNDIGRVAVPGSVKTVSR